MSRLGQRSFWKYFKEQWSWLVFGSIGGVIANTSVVLPPLLLGRAIDQAERYLNGGGAAARRTLYGVVGLYVVAILVYAGGRTAKRYGFRGMAASINCRLRADLLDAVFAWPMPRYDRERIGDIMSRAVGDVQSFTDSARSVVTEVFDTGLMMTSNFVALLVLQPRLTLLASLSIPMAVALAEWMGPRIFTRATKVREAASAINTHLQQTVVGVRVFRLLGREEAQEKRFERLSGQQREASVRFELVQSGVLPVYAVVSSLGIVLVIAWGGTDVIRGIWSLGTFTSFLTIFTSMSARTLIAARTVNRAYTGAAAWRRIESKLNVPEAEAHPASQSAASPAEVDISISDLSFRFPGASETAVSGLSVDVPAGSWIGITGPVGSGKTSLALALSGLYPYEGSIKLNGTELRDISEAQRVRLVSYLGQDAFLFSATISQNISFEPWTEADQTRLREVAGFAALSDDMALFPAGYETQVGEVGVRVSGGQRQRIALARALYPHTPVLILDDPFSAVDLATERRMVERLKPAFRGATVIMFSHRLASFPQTDRVLVLDHGRVLENGTHAELVAANGVYSRIYRAQQWMEAHGE